jgi:hypothetical protein
VPAATVVVSAANAATGTLVTATKTCPAGTKILGGGATYTVSNASRSNRVALVSSYPSSGTAWTATLRVLSTLGAGVTATVTTYAVCTV